MFCVLLIHSSWWRACRFLKFDFVLYSGNPLKLEPDVMVTRGCYAFYYRKHCLMLSCLLRIGFLWHTASSIQSSMDF